MIVSEKVKRERAERERPNLLRWNSRVKHSDAKIAEQVEEQATKCLRTGKRQAGIRARGQESRWTNATRYFDNSVSFVSRSVPQLLFSCLGTTRTNEDGLMRSQITDRCVTVCQEWVFLLLFF